MFPSTLSAAPRNPDVICSRKGARKPSSHNFLLRHRRIRYMYDFTFLSLDHLRFIFHSIYSLLAFSAFTFVRVLPNSSRPELAPPKAHLQRRPRPRRSSSYHYHTSSGGPSITAAVVLGATFLNDLSKKTSERIRVTEGLSHRRITYAVV